MIESTLQSYPCYFFKGWEWKAKNLYLGVFDDAEHDGNIKSKKNFLTSASNSRCAHGRSLKSHFKNHFHHSNYTSLVDLKLVSIRKEDFGRHVMMYSVVQRINLPIAIFSFSNLRATSVVTTLLQSDTAILLPQIELIKSQRMIVKHAGKYRATHKSRNRTKIRISPLMT